MSKRVVSSALVFGVAALAPPAHAQSSLTCHTRDKLVQTLEGRYNETLDSVGLQGPELLLEVWSAKDTGSFTVFITKPNGISCVVASGSNWQNFVTIAKEGVTG